MKSRLGPLSLSIRFRCGNSCSDSLGRAWKDNSNGLAVLELSQRKLSYCCSILRSISNWHKATNGALTPFYLVSVKRLRSFFPQNPTSWFYGYPKFTLLTNTTCSFYFCRMTVEALISMQVILHL